MSELYELKFREDLKNQFLVLKVKPIYAYRDDRRTDSVIGYAYDVLCLSDKTIGVKTIKVPGPAVTSMAQLTESDVIVAFDGLKFTAYYDRRTNRREVSIKADKVRIIN